MESCVDFYCKMCVTRKNCSETNRKAALRYRSTTILKLFAPKKKIKKINKLNWPKEHIDKVHYTQQPSLKHLTAKQCYWFTVFDAGPTLSQHCRLAQPLVFATPTQSYFHVDPELPAVD